MTRETTNDNGCGLKAHRGGTPRRQTEASWPESHSVAQICEQNARKVHRAPPKPPPKTPTFASSTSHRVGDTSLPPENRALASAAAAAERVARGSLQQRRWALAPEWKRRDVRADTGRAAIVRRLNAVASAHESCTRLEKMA
eukprot:CAMPEP_0202092494 /NCGR_PEP_ID=MMETSP0964-20121228/48064_1 /ASSEMBLY_ACC=CAM_ASM_000500 /TAXON_ID=4773 /ORGANISM="Schizochytrium aggregatum, Strain ATCC28209" /LENGTH=141 /DNA_ID=CAMNT_0048660733 /DNA_START=681 /DNA_END=1107 /DNA_ORIENTATION=+